MLGILEEKKLLNVYDLYQKKLKENNAIDFDDIINYHNKNFNRKS